MFQISEKPCSPNSYNQLPDILDADANVTPYLGRVHALTERGSDACRSTQFYRGEIGAFLLHKHWVIQDGEYMVESPAFLSPGKPALITAAQPISTLPASVAPSRFMVVPQSGELLSLEFSVDPVVVETWRSLVSHPHLLDRICSLICDSGMAHQVGFAIFARGTLHVGEGERLVERNWDGKSVVSARILLPDEKVIPTGWTFTSVSELNMGCIAFCEDVAGEHTREHSNIPSCNHCTHCTHGG